MADPETNAGGMTPTEQRIRALDDAAAVALLARVAGAQRHREDSPPEPDAGLRDAIVAALSDETQTTIEPSDAEAARAALILLAHDARFTEPIEKLVTNPTPEQFTIGPVEGAVLAAGLIIALKTHVLIEHKDGRWHVRIEKKPSSNSLVATVIRKLVGRWDS